VDGHNVIGRTPPLHRLEAAGQGEEARARLEEACSRFGLRHDVLVVLVFDGLPGHPRSSSPRRRHLEIVYAAEPGRADARLIARANQLAAEGATVTVVTEDGGLRRELLRGVGTRSVREFWTELEATATTPDRGRSGSGEEKRTPPIPDVERYFLEAEARRLAAESAPPKSPEAPAKPIRGSQGGKKGRKA
jgi:predicted RNA-binding protein with PIN domain